MDVIAFIEKPGDVEKMTGLFFFRLIDIANGLAVKRNVLHAHIMRVPA
jgi:hypothetical protein